jgi:hypothetical protein
MSHSPVRLSLVVVAGFVTVGALSSCGNATEPTADAAPVTVTVTPEASEVAAPDPSTSSEDPTTADVAVVDFVMPDLVGVDLQTAQNTVQGNGVFFSVSHDLRGSRSQMLDSNWIVCTQSVAAGERVTGDVEGEIDFGAVKRGESCP